MSDTYTAANQYDKIIKENMNEMLPGLLAYMFGIKAMATEDLACCLLQAAN